MFFLEQQSSATCLTTAITACCLRKTGVRRGTWAELDMYPEEAHFFCVKVELLTGYHIHSWRGCASWLNFAVYLTHGFKKYHWQELREDECLSSCPTCGHHSAQNMREKCKRVCIDLLEFKWSSLQDEKEKLRSDIWGDSLTARHSEQICALFEILGLFASDTRTLCR